MWLISNAILATVLTATLNTGDWAKAEAKDIQHNQGETQNSLEIKTVQDEINSKVVSITKRKDLISELDRADVKKDWILDSSEQQDIDTARTQLDEIIIDVQLESLSQEEQGLLAKYKKDLWSDLEGLAEQLVLGRREYISTINKKMKNIPKPVLDKIATTWWDKFYNNFIVWGDYTWYDSMHIDTPLLAKFIAENYDDLIGQKPEIDWILNIIWLKYNIAESERSIEESERSIAECERKTVESKRKTVESKRISDFLKKFGWEE